MGPWFIWNGKNSSAMGLWISKLPKIIVPVERSQTVTVPGRAGTLSLPEGEEVYDGYKKEIVITCKNDVVTPALLEWLRGSGELILSNEVRYVYQARISAPVEFTRLGTHLSQATVAFWCQPFKRSANESQYRQTVTVAATSSAAKTVTQTIMNPGQLIAKPKMAVTNGIGGLTITAGRTSMIFEHRPFTLNIDCEAGIITTTADPYDQYRYYYIGDFATYTGSQSYPAGLYRFITEGVGNATEWEYVSVAPAQTLEYLWPGNWQGEFLKIPTGSQTLTVTVPANEAANIVIDPGWRWL